MKPMLKLGAGESRNSSPNVSQEMTFQGKQLNDNIINLIKRKKVDPKIQLKPLFHSFGSSFNALPRRRTPQPRSTIFTKSLDFIPHYHGESKLMCSIDSEMKEDLKKIQLPNKLSRHGKPPLHRKSKPNFNYNCEDAHNKSLQIDERFQRYILGSKKLIDTNFGL